VRNRAGRYVLPGLRNIRAAAKTIVRVAANNGGISIVNPSKRQRLAYPICTFTYVIVPKKTAKATELKALHPLGADEGPELRAEAPLPAARHREPGRAARRPAGAQSDFTASRRRDRERGRPPFGAALRVREHAADLEARARAARRLDLPAPPR
jgi:hypothetical protein